MSKFLLDRAAKAHRIHFLATGASAEVNVAPLPSPAEVRRLLANVPRGKTKAGQLTSARMRLLFADPARRAEFLAKGGNRAELARQRPRMKGRWLPSPVPSSDEQKASRHAAHVRRALSSASRFLDPTFRAKVAAQLAQARAKRKGSPRVAAAAAKTARRARLRELADPHKSQKLLNHLARMRAIAAKNKL